MTDFISGVARFELRRQINNQLRWGEMGASAALPGEGGGSRFETRLQNDNQPRQGERRAGCKKATWGKKSLYSDRYDD